MADVEEAHKFAVEHFAGNPKCFNYPGWKSLFTKYGGMLPLRVKALKEGTLASAQNALITIENTDPEFYWLTNWAETVLLQVWYPITVGTLSRAIKQIIGEALVRTGDPAQLPYKLHDFGFRGVSSRESAAIGGAAHLFNFLGTDNLAAVELLQQYYCADMPGVSIPASEHSTITAWGREHEADAFQNVLDNVPDGIVACVSDSYDIFKAVRDLWGGKLRDKVMQRNGTLVIRPDSGASSTVIAAMTGTKSRLRQDVVKAITGGTDAQGEVSVRVEEAGKTTGGNGADTDIIVASAKAYLNALNKLAYWASKNQDPNQKIGLV